MFGKWFSTASPEGGRLLAQGVSPGYKRPILHEPRQGRQTSFSEREPWISAAPGGALKAFYALSPGLTPWARSLAPSGLASWDFQPRRTFSRHPLRILDLE